MLSQTLPPSRRRVVPILKKVSPTLSAEQFLTSSLSLYLFLCFLFVLGRTTYHSARGLELSMMHPQRLVEHFLHVDQQSGSGFLAAGLQRLRTFRGSLLAFGSSHSESLEVATRYDVVLLGGLLGSIFSAAQWMVRSVKYLSKKPDSELQ